MIVLAITLAAWAILRKYARKPRTSSYNTPSVVSPADIARREKEREKAAKQAERNAAKERKAEEAREQAKEDIPYFENQLSRWYEMIEDANVDLQLARQSVKHDAEMNAHGAVVAEKVVKKHIAERDKLAKKVVTLENQIHAAEKKLNNAKRIANA